MTGRVPKTGVYLTENRKPVCEINITLPDKLDDALWPMIGWLAGSKSPNGIPVLIGLEDISLNNDDLKALSCLLYRARGHSRYLKNVL